MLHPSYLDLIQTVNSTAAEGEEALVESRYSIVIAAAKRARQLVGGQKPTVVGNGKKPLSVAVEEMNCGNLKLSREGEAPEEILLVEEFQEKEDSEEGKAEDVSEKSFIEE